MEYRQLGRTGEKVSAIGLGTMTWGEQNTEAEGHAQMDMAFDRGINLFDAAELYPIPRDAKTQGRTEEIIGTWFAENGRRDDIFLATKVVGRSDATWFRKDGSLPRLTKDQISEAVDSSLKRLQTDHIDLYQIHWPDRPLKRFGPLDFERHENDGIPIGETLEALGSMVAQGKIRYIGLSNETAWGTMEFLRQAELHNLPRIQSIQNAYNLVNRTFEVDQSEITFHEDVGLLAYSPLAQGYLTGKYQNGALPEGARKTLFQQLQRYEKPGAIETIDKYIALARDHGINPAQMAIQFVTTRWFVTSNLIGATSLEQLKTNIDSIDLPWSDELEQACFELHQLNSNPCP